jgi:polysaccharide pyruvyl transferase WcaK-like protein
MSNWLNVKTLERSGKSNLLKVYKAVFSTDVLIVGGACVISDYQKNLKGLISG